MVTCSQLSSYVLISFATFILCLDFMQLSKLSCTISMIRMRNSPLAITIRLAACLHGVKNEENGGPRSYCDGLFKSSFHLFCLPCLCCVKN